MSFCCFVQYESVFFLSTCDCFFGSFFLLFWFPKITTYICKILLQRCCQQQHTVFLQLIDDEVVSICGITLHEKTCQVMYSKQHLYDLPNNFYFFFYFTVLRMLSKCVGVLLLGLRLQICCTINLNPESNSGSEITFFQGM